MNGLQQRYGADVEFVIYRAIDQDEAAAAFADTHAVRAVPTMMLVDPTGSEVQRYVGAQPEERLSADIERLIAAKPPE